MSRKIKMPLCCLGVKGRSCEAVVVFHLMAVNNLCHVPFFCF